jgi:hypothetical protein
MSPFEFAERMQARAVNAMVNPLAGLQQIYDRNKQVDFAGRVASLNNAQNNGVQFMVNPQTGQIMGVRMNPDGTVTSVPVNTAAGGGQPTPAPVVAGGNIPLPSGVAPSTAGAGRGTMDWRTDPRVVDPQAGAVPSSMAQPVAAVPLVGATPQVFGSDFTDPEAALLAGQPMGQNPIQRYFTDAQGRIQLLQPAFDLSRALSNLMSNADINVGSVLSAASPMPSVNLTQPAVDATWWASLTPQQQQQLIASQQLVNPSAPDMTIPLPYNRMPNYRPLPSGVPAPATVVQGQPLPVTIPMPAAPSNVVPGAPNNWLTNIPR